MEGTNTRDLRRQGPPRSGRLSKALSNQRLGKSPKVSLGYSPRVSIEYIALSHRRVEAKDIAYANATVRTVAEANVPADTYDYFDANATLESCFLDGTSPTQY